MSDLICERLRAPRDLRWPGDRHIAVVFNIAYEMWSPGTTSSVGPMGNMLREGLFDPNAESYGRYGAQCGADRLLRIATRNGIPASVLTSAMVAEQKPEHLRQIAQAGHDIVAHGYTQDQLMPGLTPEQRRNSIDRSAELIEQAISCRPAGWISPRVTSSADTQQALARAGFAWHGDALDDDLPYLQRFEDSEIMAIPMSVEFNDLALSGRYGCAPAEFSERVVRAIEALMRRPDETVILDIFAHGHCFGRPAAAWAVEDIMQRCAEIDALWMTTRSRIYWHCREQRLFGQ